MSPKLPFPSTSTLPPFPVSPPSPGVTMFREIVEELQRNAATYGPAIARWVATWAPQVLVEVLRSTRDDRRQISGDVLDENRLFQKQVLEKLDRSNELAERLCKALERLGVDR